MNFFLADVQTGFGTFVAFYLAQLGWPQGEVGVALTVGGIAGVVAQVPGGALSDAVKQKKVLVAIGIAMIGAAALIIAFVPSFYAVLLAELLHGLTAGLITPVIAAISLGLVGRQAMSLRTGRNYRFAAGGHAATAALMGIAGAYISKGAIFIAAALLCVPALVALSFIRSDEIQYARARNAPSGGHSNEIAPLSALLKNHKLVLFAGALVLFQFADASMLPLVGENLAATSEHHASLWMSALIIAPQIVVSIFAPWIGYHSEKKGRRPLLLLGFAVEPVRAALLASSDAYSSLVVAQVLGGITGAVIGVMTIVVLADLTAGSGRFNFVHGTVGALIGIAASLSTAATGYFFQDFGRTSGFLAIAAVACAATALLWIFLAETKPQQYAD